MNEKYVIVSNQLGPFNNDSIVAVGLNLLDETSVFKTVEDAQAGIDEFASEYEDEEQEEEFKRSCKIYKLVAV